MNKTAIEWTTFSANPLKYRDADGNVVWGCVHASPGCQHCYSEALAKRYGRGGPFQVSVMNGLTPFLDEADLHKMRTAKQIGGVPVSGSRCFIGDMTDLFGEWVPDDLLNRLFSDVLEVRTDVTWQILTKRADRLHAYLSWRYGEGRIPSRNIHVGVSVENQHFADERIPLLLQTPAAVRFISAEPLLSDIDIAMFLKYPAECLDWVIVGGESGHGARPCAMEWIESVVRQCRAALVPVFVKQLGAYVVSEQRTMPAGDVFDPAKIKLEHFSAQYPDEVWAWRAGLKDRKGGDPTEWPIDLRVRQMPTVTR